MLTNTRRLRRSTTQNFAVIKYIRIVVASYIMAVGLGMVSGFDVHAYFGSVLKQPWSLYASNGFVIFCALMLLSGLYVRSVSLGLTIVILSASVHQNLLVPVDGSLDAFGADVVLICAILACYWPMPRHKFGKPTPVQNASQGTIADTDRTIRIVPRRAARPAGLAAQTPHPTQIKKPNGRTTSAFEQPDVIMARIGGFIGDQGNTKKVPQSIYA
jgi:uncharacterized membrane protein YphA (DoxX/SURF4 family)